jgi:elongin-A
MERRGVRSLAFLAQKACIKYLKREYSPCIYLSFLLKSTGINDLGDCPYELIRPVLLKLESPEQLYQLEINSPQIIGHDGEIWLQLIRRDIPDWESKPHQPKDPKNWWKVYRKLKEQIQKDREQGAEKLRAELNSIKDEQEQNFAKVVSRKDLPREPGSQRSRTLYNYNSGKTGSKSGHKLSLLDKIRKEARDARVARLNIPASMVPKQPTKVTRAPQSFVDEYKRGAQQRSSPSGTDRPMAPRAPRPPLALSRQDKSAAGKTFQEREERLRALTSGPATAGHPLPSLKSENQMPLVDDEDLADEDEPRAKGRQSRPEPALRTSAVSPPRPRACTPPTTRFGSPGPPPKRKAEPSIFMAVKKPKVAR